MNEDDHRLYFQESNFKAMTTNATRQAGIIRGKVKVTVYISHWNDVFTEVTEDVMRDVARSYLDGRYNLRRVNLREW